VQREAILRSTRELSEAIAGQSLEVLDRAINAFAAATNPLAELQMNDVLRKTLEGQKANELDANKLKPSGSSA
jgi:hypothetical protein